MKAKYWLLFGTAAAAAAQSAACSSDFSSCTARRSCPPSDVGDAGEGGAGSSGSPNHAGDHAGGMSGAAIGHGAAGVGGAAADGGSDDEGMPGGGISGGGISGGGVAAGGISGAGMPGGGTSGKGGNGGGGTNTAGNASSGSHAGGTAGGGSGGMPSAGAGGSVANPCSANPCVNGSCSANSSNYTCACTPGFTGARCELPRFQPIPISVGANIEQHAEDVSADGSTVVGEATDFVSINRIFRWSIAGGVEDLTSRVTSPSYLSGTNSNGSVYAGVSAAGVFRWPATGTPLSAPAPVGRPQCGSNGVKISSDGSTIVGVCYSSTNVVSAVRWRMVGASLNPEILPIPTGATYAAARAVSSDGTIVAGAIAQATGSLNAVRWTSAGMDVIVIGGGAYATGMSADGQVVAGNSGNTGGEFAFKWTQSEGAEELPMPTPTAQTSVWDVNQDGSVIVGTQESSGHQLAAGEPLLWNLSGVHYIRDLLIAAGVSPSAMLNWKLGDARAVSADGKVIAGSGTDPNGLQEAWIARLP